MKKTAKHIIYKHVEILGKHPEAAVVSRALNGVEAIKLAVLLEWEPLPEKRRVLFAKALAAHNLKVVGGIAMGHFLGVARRYHMPQAVLSEISSARRFGKNELSRKTELLVDILIERALPVMDVRASSDVDGVLMKEVPVI
jgi:hypothetical protein